jgi:hypothetical protein
VIYQDECEIVRIGLDIFVYYCRTWLPELNCMENRVMRLGHNLNAGEGKIK